MTTLITARPDDKIEIALTTCLAEVKSALDGIPSPRARRAVLKYRYTPATSGCWEWCGPRDARGYGRARVDTVMGPMQRAHRLMYLLHYGPFDPAKVVRHRCNNTRCINPAHLELGTQADNMKDMVSSGRSRFGSRSPAAKLTDAAVIQIRADFPALARDVGTTGAYRQLASRYGVGVMPILNVVKGVTWKHLLQTNEGPCLA